MARSEAVAVKISRAAAGRITAAGCGAVTVRGSPILGGREITADRALIVHGVHTNAETVAFRIRVRAIRRGGTASRTARRAAANRVERGRSRSVMGVVSESGARNQRSDGNSRHDIEKFHNFPLRRNFERQVPVVNVPGAPLCTPWTEAKSQVDNSKLWDIREK